MYKKPIALLLLAAMLTTASCGDSSDIGSDTTAGGEDTTEAPITEDGFVRHSVPAGTDLGGEPIRVRISNYSDAFLADVYAEEETGTRLNDVIYRSMVNVEEELNVDLVYSYETFNYNEMKTYHSTILASILAGDAPMDIMYDGEDLTQNQMENPYFANLAEMKYIDLDKPWYNKTTIGFMPDGYAHYLTGMFAISNVKNTFAMFFNADLYESLGKTEDLYELVDSGKWTLDKLSEIINDTYTDLNGNTEADAADRYGLTIGDGNKYGGFRSALGVRVFEKKGADFEFVFANEHNTDAFDKMYKLLNENESVLKAQAKPAETPDYHVGSGAGNYASKIFTSGRSLFTCALITAAEVILPLMDFDYGMLPYPKYDETQESYASQLQRPLNVLVPTTCAKMDEASAVIEALACQHYNYVLPEYCEVTLKVRYSPDDNMSRMFDIIGSTVQYDLADAFYVALGNPGAKFSQGIRGDFDNWASKVASIKESTLAKLEDIFE